jgi:hypothetical protein
MTTAASAEQRADLKFFAVIDHAVAERLGYAPDGLIDVSHPARLSQSISNVAVSKIFDVAASSRSNRPKCCLNRITAIVAFSAFNSVIWTCLRYSSSLAFSTGRRTVLTLSSNALRSTPVIRTNPLRPTVEAHAAIDERKAVGAQPIDDQKTRRPVIDGNKDEIELLQARATYGFLISERERIPPSGPHSAAPIEKSPLPSGYRPRGAPDPAAAPRPQLDCYDPFGIGRRDRKQTSPMPALHTPNSELPEMEFMTQ